MSLRVNNLVGFGGGGDVPVGFIDDGDAAPSSGTGTTAHTYNSITSTGPVSVVLISWVDTTTNALSTITFDGNSMTILEQWSEAGGTDRVGGAICIIDGAQSGNIVATFDANTNDSEISVVSLTGLLSLSAIDTDRKRGSGSSLTLDALTNPGGKGIILAIYSNSEAATAVTWTNTNSSAGFSNLDTGASYRHSCDYVLGNPAADIVAAGSLGRQVLVGVSLR
jgi:hypothetical protein